MMSTGGTCTTSAMAILVAGELADVCIVETVEEGCP